MKRKTPHAKTLDHAKTVSRDGERVVLDAISAMTRMQVATALDLSYDAVRQAEDRGLAKLRRNPELLRLWARYRAEGGGAPLREDVGEQLLEFQLEVARWYDLAERLGKAGLEAERQECLKVVAIFQQKLSEAFAR